MMFMEPALKQLAFSKA